jgi:prephenate dehydrogenase
MSVHITIIGLGQVGASFGLALGARRDLVNRLGYDRELGIAKRAEKLGAVDKSAFNLPASVEEADLVLLSLPVDQIRETVGIIAPELREGAVVMDTSPAKESVSAWMAEFLPAERFYIGLTPAINPAYLNEFTSGVEAARADLFKDSLIAITSPLHAPAEALKLAADLVNLVGAKPLFSDALEVDGLLAATYTLPQLLAAALIGATTNQPGWQEGRKLAGRDYAQASGLVLYPNGPETLRDQALLNRENVARVIDNLIVNLEQMRLAIQDGDTASLGEQLAQACQARQEWLRQRMNSDWVGEEAPPSEVPRTSDFFGRFVGLGRKRD